MPQTATWVHSFLYVSVTTPCRRRCWESWRRHAAADMYCSRSCSSTVIHTTHIATNSCGIRTQYKASLAMGQAGALMMILQGLNSLSVSVILLQCNCKVAASQLCLLCSFLCSEPRRTTPRFQSKPCTCWFSVRPVHAIPITDRTTGVRGRSWVEPTPQWACCLSEGRDRGAVAAAVLMMPEV